LSALLAAPSMAQVATGRIDATVRDTSGALLSGVTMDIAGPQYASAVTDALGQVHFLNLAPGSYTVVAKHAGLSDYLNRHVPVTAGQTVALSISMWTEGVATQVHVASGAPSVAIGNVTTTTNLDVEELQDIPSARDPWVMLQTVPGVIVDRANVGGAESGDQSTFLAKGASSADNSWSIDGIPVTDLSATGTTPTYFDFDQFQEISVTTGGADLKNATPGVQTNLILKSGADVPHGSTRIYFENDGLESTNMTPALAATIGGDSGEGDRTHLYDDFGLELGGPILRHRLWAWGSAGKTHIDILGLAGAHDRTDFQNDALKIDGNIWKDIRGDFTFFRGHKSEEGRGASPTRPPETTWDQTGPTMLYKGEVDLSLGGRLFLAARAAHVAEAFTLTPEGGLNANWYVDDSGVNHGSELLSVYSRPEDTASADGNLFHGRHEVKFGMAWRKADVRTDNTYPGNGIVTHWNGYPELLAEVTQNTSVLTSGQYVDAYVGDTWSRDRLTVSFGARWDRQASSLDAASMAANLFPGAFLSVTAKPVHDAIVWKALTPRVGVTYALNKSHTTIARATYSMFPSQLSATAAQVISPTESSNSSYFVIDANGNHLADPDEFGFPSTYTLPIGGEVNAIGENQIGSYKTPLAQEIQVGMDHELMPNFGVSGTFTYRYYYDYDWNAQTYPTYVQTGTCVPATAGPCGSVNDVTFLGNYSVPFYAGLQNSLDFDLPSAIYEVHPGYHTRYLGLELSATKPLAHRWMARVGFSTNDDREYFSGANPRQDPTPTVSSPRLNGGQVVTDAAGSGQSTIYMVLPHYQVTGNGMWQGPRGVDVAFNWLLRQGYAEPYYRSDVPTGGVFTPFKSVLLVSDAGKFRLRAYQELDGRVEKTLAVWKGTLALDLDVFNLLNAATPLGKQYDVRRTGPAGLNQTLEIMGPRIARLGARFSF
ncbi:MAG: carboxypeptidase regulatory-like domain-containing protein, partial [Vicinamibacterales bacterium]